MPRPTLSNHYLDQIDEDHFALEQLFRAVKSLQARLYAVEASQRSVLREVAEFTTQRVELERLTYDAHAVRQRHRARRE